MSKAYPAVSVSLVAAMALNRVIGRKGRLPWTLPGDLRLFRTITLKCGNVIMGRKTYDSILAQIGKPLEGRQNIVLTRGHKDVATGFSNATAVSSSEEALRVAGERGNAAAVIGGAEIYKLFLCEADWLYLTKVHSVVRGDTFFPTIEWERWRLHPSSGKPRRLDPRDEYDTTIEVYRSIESP